MKSKVNRDTQPSHLTVTHETRVRFNETDALGIVWHGNYLKYFEDGREAFGRKHGLSYLDIEQNGFYTPIVKSMIEHLAPLKFGDIATIKTTLINTRAAKLIFRYEINDQHDTLVCKGETTQVFIDTKKDLAIIAPAFFKTWKAQHNLD
ncbi:MAG: 4-hydroxybenzoyl-CoA thioesterase [Cytophagaceae bacterium]|nr:4-hydroxybenzoyl-CoA thioesterase [Cytophagaceae bacterium]|tara:strand:+ start:1591 stop:2037 length:447 start_codon:yes stop_codon:yes gene_type:complete